MMRFTAHFTAKVALLILLFGGSTCLTAAVSASPAATSSSLKQRLLTSRQLAKLKKMMQQEVENLLNLAGLGKLSTLPAFSEELAAYRNEQGKKDAQTAPFLGWWTTEWDYFPPYYYFAVFPSQVKGRVCVIEYQDNQYKDNSSPPPGETIPPNPPPKFSVARISRGQIAADGFWLHQSLIKPVKEDWMSNKVEFLGVARATDKIQVYASKQIAKLDPNSPSDLMKKFKANQCISP